MLGDGAFAGLEDACDEVEEGRFAGSVGAENGYTGVHTVGDEVGLVRFETAGAGKRSGKMMEESRKEGRKQGSDEEDKGVEQRVEMDEVRRVGVTKMIEITVGMS